MDKRSAAQVRLRLRKLFSYGPRRGMVHVAVLIFGATLATADAPAAEPTRPEFDQVARAAADSFRSQTGYQDGDLVSQQHVAAALDAVADAGWEVPRRDRIEDLALADGSFLVRELSTKSGQKFMRKIAGTRGAYERLDRLSSISGGQRSVRDLIHQRGGEDLIKYMATTPGGRNLGRMMAATRNGVDLNKPTGRIYTADDLLAVLKKAYRQTTP